MLSLRETSRWKAGDLRRSGKIYENSGIALDLADAATPGDLVRSVRHTLSHWRDKGISLTELDLDGELSIGTTVRDSVQFTAHFDFSDDDLFLLGMIDIALSVAAYPTSDEANEKHG